MRGSSADAALVRLCVYDLVDTAVNDKLLKLGLGIFHTGVEVFGQEYWFFGHSFDFSGVVVLPPGLTECGQMRRRETIEMGHVAADFRDPQNFAQLLDELSLDYRGSTYHMINRNCNHFSAELVRRIVKPSRPAWGCWPGSEAAVSIPAWINRAAYLGSHVLGLISEETAMRLLMRVASSEARTEEGSRALADEPAASVDVQDESNLTKAPQERQNANGGEPNAQTNFWKDLPASGQREVVTSMFLQLNGPYLQFAESNVP